MGRAPSHCRKRRIQERQDKRVISQKANGANLKWFEQLRSATSHPIIAAGGIKAQREIRALDRLGMDAAVGMALYKNRLR